MGRVAIPESTGERVKEALRKAGWTVTSAAQHLGLDRTTLSTKISRSDFQEPQIEAIAEMTGESPAYLRYGLRGDYAEGVRSAARWVRAAVDTLERQGLESRFPVGGSSDDADEFDPPSGGARRRRSG